MAVTTTTASDLVLEPTDGQFAKLVAALREHEGRNWTVGDMLNVRFPRDVGTFTSRQNGDETVSEHELFTRLSVALDGAIDTATLKRLRNTAAAYRSEDRTVGISWSAHRAGEALAWRDDQGHRANLVSWFRSDHRTVRETEDHVKTMLSKLDGTVVKETETDTEPNGHDVGATATESVTGDEMVAAIIALTDRHDGTEPTEPKAATRALSLAARALGMVPTEETEKVSERR